MHNFSGEDLIQFMYNESSKEKTIAINAALQSDWNLKEMYQNLNESKQKLVPVRKSPRKQTIDSILDYAQKSLNQLTASAL